MVAARINSALIRRINTARVFHALREHPDSPQRRLAALTGLDAATVSTIVAQLQARGIVARAAAAPRDGAISAGRPASALRINPDAGWLIGVQIDLGLIRLVAAGLDGVVRQRMDTPGSAQVSVVLRRLQSAVAALLDRCGTDFGSVRGIGIGIPALIDTAGRMVLAPNLRWRDPMIPARMQALFPVPARVDNDSRTAALAERLFGTCRGVPDFVFLYGRTGIGGCLYGQGSMNRGVGGLAGEIGHMKVAPGGRRCSCGGQGCLEAYVSNRAIHARLDEAGHHLPDTAAVAAAAASGDPLVRGVLTEAGAHLGLALANLMNVINPGHIVLGGNLAVLSPYLLPAARRAIADNALAVPAADARIVVSTLGSDAVALGGIALAMEDLLPMGDALSSAQQGQGAAPDPGLPALLGRAPHHRE